MEMTTCAGHALLRSNSRRAWSPGTRHAPRVLSPPCCARRLYPLAPPAVSAPTRPGGPRQGAVCGRGQLPPGAVHQAAHHRPAQGAQAGREASGPAGRCPGRGDNCFFQMPVIATASVFPMYCMTDLHWLCRGLSPLCAPAAVAVCALPQMSLDGLDWESADVSAVSEPELKVRPGTAALLLRPQQQPHSSAARGTGAALGLGCSSSPQSGIAQVRTDLWTWAVPEACARLRHVCRHWWSL